MVELSLHLLDMIQNAIEAGASRIKITIDENLEADTLLMEVEDNGKGMSEDQIAKVRDPFYTTRKTRHVGLGLPLLLEACRRCDGDLDIRSTPGIGTTIQATFRHSHIDRAPIGDIPSALLAVLLTGKPVDWLYTHQVNEKVFRADTSEIRRELIDVPLSHPKVRKWLFDFLQEGENSLSWKSPPVRATA